MADQLAGLRPAGAETHAVDDVIQAALQGIEHLLARNPFLDESLLVKVAELSFEETVIAAGLLFFAKLKSIAYQLGLAILAMLAGGEVTLLNSALFGVAALPFQEQFHSLSAALPADGTRISSHSFFSYLSS